MGRATFTLAVASLLLLPGCGGSSESTQPVPCNDAAFRGQDEELYVTQAAVSNAIGGAGDLATVLDDLRRARSALAGYLDLHPPCDDALTAVAATERQALVDLDEAIDALDQGNDAAEALQRSLEALRSAQSALFGGP